MDDRVLDRATRLLAEAAFAWFQKPLTVGAWEHLMRCMGSYQALRDASNNTEPKP